MSDRSLPFYENLLCDGCGELGATDFMGDYYCSKCVVPDEDGTLRHAPKSPPSGVTPTEKAGER